MIEEGYRKVTDGIKTLQTETNSTKGKDKM